MANLVTNAGLANITAAILAYANRPRYLQWGVGSGQAVTDTDIADKTGTTEARTLATTSQQTDDVADDTYQAQGTITALNSLAITEVGVFDEAGSGTPPAGGNMTTYGDFGVITLDPADSITFTVTTKFS